MNESTTTFEHFYFTRCHLENDGDFMQNSNQRYIHLHKPETDISNIIVSAWIQIKTCHLHDDYPKQGWQIVT